MRREKSGTSAAEIQSTDHYREHAGGTQSVRCQVGSVGNQDADGDFDRTIVNTTFDPVHDPACNQAYGHTGNDQVSQASDAACDGRSFVAQYDGDAEFQGQEAGGVVHQALALDQVGDSPGDADALRYRRGCDGIGGRDDGAQDQPEFPVEAGK